MDFFSRSDDNATHRVNTAAAARARLRERADELKPTKSDVDAEHLAARPQRLRWSGRHQA